MISRFPPSTVAPTKPGSSRPYQTPQGCRPNHATTPAMSSAMATSQRMAHELTIKLLALPLGTSQPARAPKTKAIQPNTVPGIQAHRFGSNHGSIMCPSFLHQQLAVNIPSLYAAAICCLISNAGTVERTYFNTSG